MTRNRPPRKVTYFEPVAPRLAPNTLIESFMSSTASLPTTPTSARHSTVGIRPEPARAIERRTEGNPAGRRGPGDAAVVDGA
jgi:hypothetical protein